MWIVALIPVFRIVMDSPDRGIENMGKKTTIVQYKLLHYMTL